MLPFALSLAVSAALAAEGPATPSAQPSTAQLAGVPSDIAQEIWQIELLRLPPISLAPLMKHPDAAVRARVADGLGRMRDPDAVIPLAALLEDSDEGVREEAAFALGQTPGGDVPLGRRWPVEMNLAVRLRMAVALGKQGDAAAVDMLIPALTGPASVGAADGLGRLAMRKVVGATADNVVAALLDTTVFPIGETRRRAAWALSRMGISETSADNAMRLRQLALTDGDVLVRAWALRAWLGVATDAARLDGLALAVRDKAVGVRIAAARGMARAEEFDYAPLLVTLLADPDMNVRIEAIAAVPSARGADAARLLARPFASPEPAERAAALRALVASKALSEPVARWTEPTEPMVVRIAAVECLTDRNRLLFLALNAPEPAIRSAAAGVLLDDDAPRPAELVALLAGADLTIADAAAQALGAHPDPAVEGPLLDFLRRKGLLVEQAVSGVKALAALYDTGRLPRPNAQAGAAIRPWLRHPSIEADAERLAGLLGVAPPPRRHPARRMPALQQALRIRSARIYTDEGEIRVALEPDQAPYTVWNFARLAEDGYYDGLVFHRVVSDFVIQAGCPRGDGWGGPGYEIPDEINPIPYGAGVLGMALSGPDTGGSQWFITLAPQPHLDGTYTVFGHVTYGMRAVSAIQVGDRIDHIEIERVP